MKVYILFATTHFNQLNLIYMISMQHSHWERQILYIEFMLASEGQERVEEQLLVSLPRSD